MTAIVDQLLAGDRRARADALLRLPDATLLHLAEEIRAAVANDEDFSLFVDVRIGALHARRDGRGLLPEAVGKPLWAWLKTMAKFAAGEGGPGASG